MWGGLCVKLLAFAVTSLEIEGENLQRNRQGFAASLKMTDQNKSPEFRSGGLRQATSVQQQMRRMGGHTPIPDSTHTTGQKMIKYSRPDPCSVDFWPRNCQILI